MPSKALFDIKLIYFASKLKKRLKRKKTTEYYKNAKNVEKTC